MKHRLGQIQRQREHRHQNRHEEPCACAVKAEESDRGQQQNRRCYGRWEAPSEHHSKHHAAHHRDGDHAPCQCFTAHQKRPIACHKGRAHQDNEGQEHEFGFSRDQTRTHQREGQCEHNENQAQYQRDGGQPPRLEVANLVVAVMLLQTAVLLSGQLVKPSRIHNGCERKIIWPWTWAACRPPSRCISR